MKRYNHDLLLVRNSGTVQKTYRLPRFLEEYIASVAAGSNLTNTDIVIEALLHYFSPHIVVEMTSDIEHSQANVETSRQERNEESSKKYLFEKRRLEMLRAEFYEYFSDSMEKLLARLESASTDIQSEKIAVRGEPGKARKTT